LILFRISCFGFRISKIPVPFSKNKFIVSFDEVDKDDIGLVGGKGANLGEMVNTGFPVPPGFIVTSKAYQYFIKKNALQEKIKKHLSLLDINDPESLNRVSKNIRSFINRSKIPKLLVGKIFKAYEGLDGRLKYPLVAVRSSATAEDLPDASFAGQQETFLNVKGEAVLAEKIRDAWSSLFTPRAIFYRAQKGFDHFKVAIAIPVQKMIQSDVSGVMFTINPSNNDKKTILIEAIYGLGELIVQGSVTPDKYEVDKQALEIKNKKIESQKVYLTKAGTENRHRKVRKTKQKKQKLSDKQIIELAGLGKKLHQHYFFPQDIEWAVEKGKIYILQTRPVTTLKQKAKSKKQKEETKIKLSLIVKGEGASPGLVSGKAQIVRSPKEITKVDEGEVLVTSMTSPDFVPAMRKAIAIVTDKGGQTSHAAIVSRELGVPCVVGTHQATAKIKSGDVITVDGRAGKVFKGQVDLGTKKLKFQKGRSLQSRKDRPFLRKPLKTATKIYVNLAEPHLAKKIAKKNVDGVGLLRAEFMIAQIGTHPKKLIQQGKQKEFIDKLSKGLEKFCKVFDDRPVIYRTTDFKTNEYKNLVGGKEFEPDEENPMLGFRGIYRYIVQPEVFELELEAIKKARNKKGYRNLHLMLPFVRTVNELLKIKRFIAACGLTRRPSFKLWMMVEVPSNVVALKKFIKVGIDGISIGSNDLTMLTLGVDRDNENISSEFNELDPAVLWMLKRAIKTAQKAGITSSICGQAPSLYPDLAEKLVRWGITSISVSPDMIEKTRQIVYDAEKQLISKK